MITMQMVVLALALQAKVVLLYKKGDPSILSNFRPIALINAVYQLLNHWPSHASPPALRLLLSRGADVNMALHQSSGFAGRSPLINAAGGGKVDCVRMLLRAGADIYATEPGGPTTSDLQRGRMVSMMRERPLSKS